MKKALSLILALVVALSCCGLMAFAADDNLPDPPAQIDYVVDGVIIATVYAQSGQILTEHTPDYPVKEDTDTTRYTFKGWRSDYDNILYYKSTQLAVPELAEGETLHITMTAEFSEEDISGNQSFWNFIESIFERLNLIFEYFATVFNW